MASTTFVGAAIAAFVVGSFIEYWVHRLMHKPNSLVWYLLGETHRGHHKGGTAAGVLWELLKYLKGAVLVFLWPFWLVSDARFQWGWFCGTALYSVFAAFSHQMQHENPYRIFWMPMPVHYVHHKYNMSTHNFGLAVDWWDHCFRTYKPMGDCFRSEKNIAIAKQRGFFQLKWL